ncbi:MAG TPA: sugar porter family MFS transporter [Prolixibacteraceae bacterium]|nr:sugar porter family MFS transporter [Prolixibacteraceae bacterium]HPR84822.1 sugar porter family MFS transporter [Prolixibacteraceae bacterium]
MNLNKRLIFITLTAALGGFLFGFDTAVISGATSALEKLFSLDKFWLGFTVAIALIGTIIGTIVVGKPADKYGRRQVLFYLAVFYALSALGCAMAFSWMSLLFFRFLGGIAVGGVSVVGPMYIAEIAPAKFRGRLVGMFQFNVVLGILMAYFSNYIVGLFDLGDAEWRWKLGVMAIPSILFFVTLFFIPRSPRWLIKMGLVDEARAVLKITGEEFIEKEIAEIQESIAIERRNGKELLFSKKFSLPIFLAVSIAMFNQLSGINGLLYYLNDIFAQAGFSKVSGDLQSVAIGATNLIFTMLAMTIIDKVGRKLLLLIGSIGTASSLAGVAFIFFTNSHQNLLVWLLIGYIAFFGFSQGAVIWVYISEVFPNSVRSKGQALGSFTHWAMAAVVSWTFPVMAEKSGGYPFLFFAAMMLLQFFVVKFLYVETKGKSLEALQKELIK